MEWNFGIMELIFLISCIIIFIQNRMKRPENEIDRVLREAEQVKYKNIESIELIYIRSEIHDDEIFIWNTIDNTFLTQGKTFEDAVQKFMKNNPNKRLQIKVTE